MVPRNLVGSFLRKELPVPEFRVPIRLHALRIYRIDIEFTDRWKVPECQERVCTEILRKVVCEAR